MDNVYAILFFVALFAVGLGLHFLRQRVNRALNRKVFNKGMYQRQQEMTETIWVFRAYADMEDVIDEVGGRLANDQQKMIQNLRRQGNKLFFGYSKIKSLTSFDVEIAFDYANSETIGQFRLLQWLETGGIGNVYGMESVLAMVKDAFEAVDPQFTVEQMLSDGSRRQV